MAERTAAPTLRRRLLRSLLVPLTTLAAVGVITDYLQARRLAEDSYDQVLASTAAGLASRLELERDGDLAVHLPPAPTKPRAPGDDQGLRYAIIDPQGRVSFGLPDLQGVAGPPPRDNTVRFHDEVLSGEGLRVATYVYAGPEGRGTIVVAESLRKRRVATLRVMRSSAWTSLAMVAVTLIAVVLAVRHALRPLDDVSEQFAQREAKDLQPLALDGVLGEMRPLVRSVNQLIGRVRAAATAQQSFLSNTAHQLRTPLAGLRTQLELLADTDLPPTAHDSARAALAAAERLTRLTHQMLALARTAPEAQTAGEPETVDLPTLLEDIASSFLDKALARHIDLGFAPAPARVAGSTWMLRELLGNLVDNAIAYTPAGGRVTVSCGAAPPPHESQGTRPWLMVEDNGPGIAPAERGKVVERFYRIPGTPGGGSGLGLAIVQEIAERHGAELELSGVDDGSGTRVRVVFPAQPAPSPTGFP